MSLSLANLQRQFKQDLLQRSQLSVPLIRSSKKYSAERRLQVYQYAVVERLHESLVEDFPRTYRLAGKNSFEHYLTAYPSRSESLAELGASLSIYFAEQNEPALAELARFEWSCILSENAGAASSKMQKIDTLAQDDLASVQLVLDESVIPFQSEWRVQETPVIKQDCFLLIAAVDGDAQVNTLEPWSFRMLQKIASGQSMQDVLSGLDGQTEEVISRMFFEWVRNKIIVGWRKP